MDRSQVIGERIQERRLHLARRFPGEYTQEAVADKLTEMGFPVSHTSLSHYERGRTPISAELLGALAKVLDVRVGWLYGDKELSVDDFTEEVVQESIRMVAALDGKPDEVSQAAKDHVLRTFRTIRSTVGT